MDCRPRDALIMRPVRLARIAAEAEGVRLRGLVSRILTRVVLGVVALLFVLGAVVFVHIGAWFGLQTGLGLTPLAATGIVGGVDLLLAIVLGALASRSTPSRVELEALDVRRKAIQSIGSTLSLTQLAIPLIRIVANMRRKR
jgi:hypothetical protein